MLHSPASCAQVLIDLKEVAAGSLEEDWDMLEPKKIKVGPGYTRGSTDTLCGMAGWSMLKL